MSFPSSSFLSFVRPLLPVVAASIGTLLFAAPAMAGEKERLEKGEIIVSTVAVAGYDMPKARIKAIIKATPPKVWGIIEKCNDYEKTMPRIANAKEVSRKGTTITCDVTVALPFPLSDLQAVTRAEHTQKNGVFKRAWKLVRGDYKVGRGYWQLSPYGDGQTLVEYEVFAVPNIPLPTFLQETAQRNSLPNMIEKLRKQTEK